MTGTGVDLQKEGLGYKPFLIRRKVCSVLISVDNVVARPVEFFFYFLDMLLVTGLDDNLQITGVDVGGFSGPVVVYWA